MGREAALLLKIEGEGPSALIAACGSGYRLSEKSPARYDLAGLCGR